jgi:xylulokinase
VSEAIVLTLDLGTSATKAALWSGAEIVAMGRGPIDTAHPRAGWAEQDPRKWWASVVEACERVRQNAPEVYAGVEAIGFSAARETYAPFDHDLHALRPGILWSDQRAATSATRLAPAEEFRSLTGVILNGACHAAKVVWLAEHEPAVFEAARWLLAPRDLVVAHMTGQVVTDPSLASRTGWYTLVGGWTREARAWLGERLPPVRPSVTVVNGVQAGPARELAVREGVAVVLGAGDRACEVLGVDASAVTAMVSWGTTTNVSVPNARAVAELPAVAQVSFGALGGHLVEAGLSASGAALAWVASLTGREHDTLLDAAAAIEPGARGVIALPWLHGARAPWWRSDAHGAFVGLTAAHGPGDLARAVVEAVALDVARCLELVTPEAGALALAGAGSGNSLWRQVLAAATGRPVVRRAVDDAASVGARVVVGGALGHPVSVEELNPVVVREEPDASLVDRYRELRLQSDTAAAAILRLKD